MKILSLFVLGLILLSCSKATESYVSGYWEMESGTLDGYSIQGEFRIQFFKDNTGRWGSSYYTLDSIYWSFDKNSQVIHIDEMKSDSSLELRIIEKKRNWMHCISDSSNLELYFNRL